jgi:hypothetical protein
MRVNLSSKSVRGASCCWYSSKFGILVGEMADAGGPLVLLMIDAVSTVSVSSWSSGTQTSGATASRILFNENALGHAYILEE